MHGGKALVGVASPSFVTGQHSKNLPSRLSQTFVGALNDPDLLNLKSDIALSVSRRDDLLGRVDTGEAGELWRSLKATYAETEKQRRRWDLAGPSVEGEKAKAAFFETLETVGMLISEGVQDYQAWDEVNKMTEQRRKLAETETKRLKELNQMVTTDKAMAFVGALLGIVKNRVTDRSVLSAIVRDVDDLLTSEVSGRA